MAFLGFLMVVFAVILPIVATILAYILIIPEKKAPYLSQMMHKIRDFLIMRNLVLERVVRALYVFFAMFATFGGFIFGFAGMIMACGMKRGGWSFGGVLLGIILGLLVGAISVIALNFSIRILFENIMLKLRLVKNTDMIYEKLGGHDNRDRGMEEHRRMPAPQEDYRRQQQPAPQPAPRVRCRSCGAIFDPRRGGCPNGCDGRW